MQKYFVLLSICFSAVHLAKTKCNKADMTFKSQMDALVSPPQLRRNEGSTGVTTRTVYGSFSVLDGCSFIIDNFTISPPCSASYWYGVPNGQPEGVLYPRIVPAALGSASGQSFKYSFNDLSWSDMDGMIVYCELESAVLGKVFWVPDKTLIEDDGAFSIKPYATIYGLLIFAVCLNRFFL